MVDPDDDNEPLHALDLASVLGVGIEEAVIDGRLATVALCSEALRRRAYWAFLAGQDAGGRSLHEAHPQAATFLAQLEGEPVGAAALIPDSALGLPLPDGFQATVTRLRREGRMLALLDPLVIPAGLAAHAAGLVLRALLRLAILTARRLDGRSDFLVRCEPRHARFFAQALLFTVEAAIPAVDDAPAQVLLRLDLDLCPGDWLRLYGDGAWSPYGLYIRPTPQSARVLGWLRRNRQPPGFRELIASWIDPVDGTPPLDRASLAALCRLHPGLGGQLAARGAGGGAGRPERAVGTGPIPRIRTPLPDHVHARSPTPALTRRLHSEEVEPWPAG